MDITNVKQLKVNNLNKILISLLSMGKGTKMDLANFTNLSNSTLSESINKLCEINVVRANGVEESIGGRCPSIYSINAEYGCFIGLCIDKNGVEANVVDFCGNVLKNYELLPLESKPMIILVYETIEKIMHEFSSKNLLGIGFSATGKIDYHSGVISTSSEINWHNVHLKELVERKFFLPTYIDHKMNNATLFESLLGNAVGLKNFMFLCNFYKNKVGIYSDGKILRGECNLAGTVRGFEADQEMLENIRNFLSLDTILYGYNSTKEVVDNKPYIKPVEIKDGYFPRAAALMAEKNWFESIYFQM